MTSFIDPMHAFLPPGDEPDACDFGQDLGGDMGLFGGVDDPLDFSRHGMQQALMRRFRSPENEMLPSVPEFDLKSDPLQTNKTESLLGTPLLAEPIGALESSSSASSLTSAGTAAPPTGQRDLRFDEQDSMPHASPHTPMLINSSPDLGPSSFTDTKASNDEVRVATPPMASPESFMSPLARDSLGLHSGSLSVGMMPIHERAFATHRMSMPALSLNMSQLATPTQPTRNESLDLTTPELSLSRMRLNTLSSPQATETSAAPSWPEKTPFMPQSFMEPLRSPHVLRSSVSTVGFGNTQDAPLFGGMQSPSYPLFIDPLSTNALALGGAAQSQSQAPQTPRGSASPMRRGRPQSGRVPRKVQSTPHFGIEHKFDSSPMKTRGQKGLRKIASNRRMAATYVNHSMTPEAPKRQGRLQARGSMAALRQANNLQASMRQSQGQSQRRPLTLSFVNYGIEDAEELCAAVAPSGSYKVPLRGHDERESSDPDDAGQRSDTKSHSHSQSHSNTQFTPQALSCSASPERGGKNVSPIKTPHSLPVSPVMCSRNF